MPAKDASASLRLTSAHVVLSLVKSVLYRKTSPLAERDTVVAMAAVCTALACSLSLKTNPNTPCLFRQPLPCKELPNSLSIGCVFWKVDGCTRHRARHRLQGIHETIRRMSDHLVLD